ncbi:MAG: hypothetical protein WCS42_08355 [Verrucomicrobiota bacterium]
MNPLESRKQLLIAESELNREQLTQEWQAVSNDVHALASRAKTIGSIASVAAALVAGVATFRRAKSTALAAQPSWPQTILKGAGLVSTLWQAFRVRRSDQKEQ